MKRMLTLLLVVLALSLTSCAGFAKALGGKIGIAGEFMGAKVELSYDSRPLVSLVAEPIKLGTDAAGLTDPTPAPVAPAPVADVAAAEKVLADARAGAVPGPSVAEIKAAQEVLAGTPK